MSPVVDFGRPCRQVKHFKGWDARGRDDGSVTPSAEGLFYDLLHLQTLKKPQAAI